MVTEQTKSTHFRKLHDWLHKHPRRTYLVAAIGLVLAGGLTTTAVLWRNPEPAPVKKAAVTEPKKEEPKPIYYSPLTGAVIASEADATKPVTAVMLENSPDARPQSGLKEAEVVYEAVAEGGITRFLALYQQNQPGTIGPVRSLRMYYVDWLTPYNASVAHVGGSAEALKLVRNGSYRDIDQFFNAGSYIRASDRYAPHNVYTDFTKLSTLNSVKGYISSSPKTMERADDKKDLPQDATSVDINISGPMYNSSYSYNPDTKVYARSQAGAPHLDREQGQIEAKVVIAIRVTMQRVLEDGYRESITTIGNGEATIFQNGTAIPATWYKDSRDDQLRFVDAAGSPIQLARGTTWISAVPTTGGSVAWR